MPPVQCCGSQTIEVPFGKRSFTVFLDFQPRSQLSITVHPDSTITASVPIGTDHESIRLRLKRRAAWIARQMAYFQQFQPLPVEPQFVGGETHLFLGRQYRLKVLPGATSRIALIGAFFEIAAPGTIDASVVGKLLHAWRTNHAKALFHRRLDLLKPPFQRLSAKQPILSIRRMKKRWGSCSPSGRITLNTELLKAPLQCIDYVIAHELCHMVHPNHTTQFFRLLQRIMPDWEKRKTRLERVLL